MKFGDAQRLGFEIAARGEDMGFELGAGFAGLAQWDRGTILELGRDAGLARAPWPTAGRSFANVVRRSNGAQGEVVGSKMSDHFCSHQRHESGTSVHVVRARRRWIWFSTTTFLDNFFRAHNVLKHDN